MIIEVQFAIVKSGSSLIAYQETEGLKKCDIYIYAMEYYSAIKKKKHVICRKIGENENHHAK
jgi:hypothetical protein